MNKYKIVIEREHKKEYEIEIDNNYRQCEDDAVIKAVALKERYPKDEIRVYLGIFKDGKLIKELKIALLYRK